MALSEAQKRANLKYLKKTYDTFVLRFRQDKTPTKAEIQERAESQGESMHEYIMQAIIQRMEREKGL